MIRIRGVLLDVDGTLYSRGAAIPGAAEALAYLRDQRIPFRLLTNIDSQSPAEIAAELQEAGLRVHGDEVVSPTKALASYLRNRQRNGVVRCRFLLSPGAAAELEEYAWLPGDSDRPDCVVVGDCGHCVSYQALNEAFRDLLAGAELVALQMGRYYWREDGAYLDTGAFVRLLEYAARVEARVLGKPSPDFVRTALDELRVPAEEVLLVGDDPATDVAGAAAAGVRSAVVKTGKMARELLGDRKDLLFPLADDRGKGCPDGHPDFVMDSIADLPRILSEEVSA
ncbi:MAG: TIGR01458 family HAD-type hydrolase [Thermoleophilia bacterium]